MKHIPAVARPWRRAAGTAALGIATAAAQPALAQALVQYDDFSSSTLNTLRWLAEEGRQSGTLRLESRRNITGGQLRLEMRNAGDNVRSSGNGNARQSVVFTKGYAITAMQAAVTMRSAKVAGCATNTGTAPSSVRARVIGNFFNAGTPIPNSSMNDTFAGVQIYRDHNSTDPADTFRARGFWGTCTDDACVTSTFFTVDLASGIALNSPTTVSVSWDKSANTFTYTAGAVTKSLSYAPLKDSQAPALNSKRLEIFNLVQQCEGSRVIVSGGADFDNVFVNSQALP